MPAVKASFVFKAGDNGWTETWYLPTGDLVAVMASWQLACATRARLLGKFASIVGQRVANDPSDGMVQTASNIFPGTANIDAGPALVRDTPWNAISAKCQAAGSRRTFWMRGVPDLGLVIDKDTGEQTQQAVITTGLAAWAALAAKPGANYLVKTRTKIVIPPPPAAAPAGVFAVGGLTLAAGFTDRYVVSCPGHNYVLGQKVFTRFARRGKIPWMKGTFTVLNPLPLLGTFEVVVGRKATTSPADYEGGTYFLPITYAYAPITQITYGRYAQKRTGRILFVRPGRTLRS
jgi:hypothetical protein